MILKIDVKKIMDIIGKNGVSFFGLSKESQLKKIEADLVKNIGDWFGSEHEEVVEITFDEAVKRYGYNETMNALIVRKMHEGGIIKDRATFWVYEQYIKLCEQNNVTPIFKKVPFSRDVCKYLGYEVCDVHRRDDRGDRKYRVFRKL